MTSTVTLIKARREQLQAIRVELKQLTAQAKAERQAEVTQRKQVRAEKKAARIAKLEQRLADMKAAPVGAKALKANRKPGPVTVTKG